MKAIIFTLALAMPAALLAGCGSSSNDPGATQQAVGNAMLDRNDVIVKDLAAKNVLIVDATKSDVTKAQSTSSLQTIVNLNDKAQLTAIGKLLNEFVLNGKQILDISKQNQTTFTGDRAAYANEIKLAQFYADQVKAKLAAIDAAANPAPSSTATPAPVPTPPPRPATIDKKPVKKTVKKPVHRAPVKKTPVKKSRHA